MFIEWRRYSQKPSLPSKIPRCTRGYHEIILRIFVIKTLYFYWKKWYDFL